MNRLLERVAHLFESKEIELSGEHTTVQPSPSDRILQKISSNLGSGNAILSYDQDAVFQVIDPPSRQTNKGAQN